MNLYEKLLKIQSQLKAPKNQFNKFGNYNYRSCEDIVEAVKPLLKENKLILTISDSIEHIGERFYIKSTASIVDIEDGKTIATTAYAREEENKKGMDSSQITGSASSYARKYALNGLFCIDDTKDSDSTNDHGKTEKSISDAQVKRLFAIAKSKNITPEVIKKTVLSEFKKSKIEDLTKVEYDNLVKRIESK